MLCAGSLSISLSLHIPEHSLSSLPLPLACYLWGECVYFLRFTFFGSFPPSRSSSLPPLIRTFCTLRRFFTLLPTTACARFSFSSSLGIPLGEFVFLIWSFAHYTARCTLAICQATLAIRTLLSLSLFASVWLVINLHPSTHFALFFFFFFTFFLLPFITILCNCIIFELNRIFMLHIAWFSSKIFSREVFMFLWNAI